MTPEITVKIHPPTAGVGVLCIDGGGARGVLPLKVMKRIEDRIGLSIPLQRFFKVAFGVSSGELPWRGLSSSILTISRRPDHHGHVHQRLVY
jgi:patatin-like phospholipase/acyl hydrolase